MYIFALILLKLYTIVVYYITDIKLFLNIKKD